MTERKVFEDERQAQNQLFDFLRLDGGAAASTEMAVDGTTPVKFAFVAPAGVRAVINRVHPLYYCQNPKPDRFAGIGAAPLVNGILVEVLDDSLAVVTDYLKGDTIIQDGDWNLLTGKDEEPSRSTGVTERVAVRWTIRLSGHGLWLPPLHRLQFTVQDNLSSIAGFGPFRIMVQGALYTSDT